MGMFGDDARARSDWLMFHQAGYCVPSLGNDNSLPLEGVNLCNEGCFPIMPVAQYQWASLETVGTVVFGEAEWTELWNKALTAAHKPPTSTISRERGELVNLPPGQLLTCAHAGEVLGRPTAGPVCNLPLCLAEVKSSAPRIVGQRVLICPKHQKGRIPGTVTPSTTWRLLRIFPALYTVVQNLLKRTGVDMFRGPPLWRKVLCKYKPLFEAAAVTLIRARNHVASDLSMPPPHPKVIGTPHSKKSQSILALLPKTGSTQNTPSIKTSGKKKSDKKEKKERKQKKGPQLAGSAVSAPDLFGHSGLDGKGGSKTKRKAAAQTPVSWIPEKKRNLSTPAKTVEQPPLQNAMSPALMEQINGLIAKGFDANQISGLLNLVPSAEKPKEATNE